MKRAGLLLLCACGADATRVHLDISTGAIALDSFQLRVGDRNALGDARPAIDVWIPDDMAGQPQTVKVWGLAAGQQIAYGTTTITPVLHGSIDAAVALAAVSCGTWCPEGEAACASDGTIRCEVQVNGCLGWSPIEPCPQGAPYCSNGACATQCTDECGVGETACDSAVAMKVCGEYDSDSCRDWSPPIACAAHETCVDGKCTRMSGGCQQDGETCDDGDACTVDDACTGGACTGTPKCTTAPANADPTCSAGTCDFKCHAGYMRSGASCIAIPPTGKLVFVSSATYTGNLGGLSGADAKCQSLATNAGRAGTFKAWLSDDVADAKSRLTHATMPYVLVDGTLVATSFSDLTSGALRHAIDLDQNGVFVSAQVWTNTGTDGLAHQADPLYCCNRWTDDQDLLIGELGGSTAKTSAWTVSAETLCLDIAAIYCVQQ